MSSVISINKLEDTVLWQRLRTGFQETNHAQLAQFLAGTLVPVCGEASNRMKGFPSLHPEYTLHDQVHLLRVVELMAKILHTSVLQVLNPIEIALLILAAHFHDQGMVQDRKDLEELKRDSEFKSFQKDWEIQYPVLKYVRERFMDKNVTDRERLRLMQVEQELLDAQLSVYVREAHGKWSEDFVQRTLNDDKRLDVVGVNLASLVGKLCVSHVLDAGRLTPENGYRCDELVGTHNVNILYLAVILRLADILDFDRDRTPQELYQTINFTNEISIAEWQKHRAVEGWEISSEKIQFQMQFEHPEYHRVAHRFMDQIDEELISARRIVDSFPASYQQYKLLLPLKVERSRMVPRKNAYIYHDLEFSLSRDEIVNVLMKHKLYSSSSLCIRELLQNSLDSLRYRKALIKRDNKSVWDEGKVVFEHAVNEQGQEVVRCMDNGAGMDEDIVTRFLTNVGRSYYRSPEFEKERASLKQAGVEFDPCAQFGIGFMSCFMLGDQIRIETRRDYGPSAGTGKPLIVEINGLGNLVVIREGSKAQPVGTTVEITGRRKPRCLNAWTDVVRLILILKGYALACEFPIEARCDIQELAQKVVIPVGISVLSTKMERANLKNIKTFDYDFSGIDPQLTGMVKASVLLDQKGHLALSNSEACWEPTDGNRVELRLISKEEVDDFPDPGQTCIDGILICGLPGTGNEHMLGSWGNLIMLGRDNFLIDIRGTLKPPITPARTPPRRGVRGDNPRWDRIQLMANQARGRLWEKIASSKFDPEVFWQLAAIHFFQIPWMGAGTIWSRISLPFTKNGDRTDWRAFPSVGELEPVQKDESFDLVTLDGARIAADESLKRYEQKHYGQDIEMDMKMTAISLSSVRLRDDKLALEIRKPISEEIPPWQHCIRGVHYRIPLLHYASPLENTLTVAFPFETANRSQPIAKLVFDSQFLEEVSSLERFARNVVAALTDPKNQEELADSKSSITRWKRFVGRLYLDVEWSEIDARFQPPYLIWFDGTGHVHVTKEDFELWAEASMEQTDIFP